MGRFVIAFLSSILLLFAVSSVNASIVNWNCDDDGDGAIVMNDSLTSLNPVGDEYDLTMTGVQSWFPAHVEGDFTTDTTLDPTIRIIEDISNQTSFDWTDYHITFGMTQSFTFVSSGTLAPAGWTAVLSAVAPGYIPNGGPMGYVGTIDYYQSAGDAIAIGDIGTFGFKVSFSGTTVYAFSTEQIPTPEPTTILLLGLGAMSVIRRRRF